MGAAALGTGLGVGAILLILALVIFVYGAILVYWIIPAGMEAASDKLLDRMEQSPLFQVPVTSVPVVP
jgi:hypothetical protein